MKRWAIVAVTGIALLWTSLVFGKLATRSIRRKLRRPGSKLKALARSKRSFINGTGKIGNILFSSLPLPKGIPSERRYKLKTVFRAGDTILYRAFRPARILDMMNKLAKDSVSRGAQIDIQIFAPNGAEITKRGMFIESFNYPRGSGLYWDQTRGTIVGPGGRTDFRVVGRRMDFHKYMARQTPGKYRCLVTVWEKLSKKRYFRKLVRGRWARYSKTLIHKYYLSAAGTFHYIVK